MCGTLPAIRRGTPLPGTRRRSRVDLSPEFPAASAGPLGEGPSGHCSEVRQRLKLGASVRVALLDIRRSFRRRLQRRRNARRTGVLVPIANAGGGSAHLEVQGPNSLAIGHRPVKAAASAGAPRCRRGWSAGRSLAGSNPIMMKARSSPVQARSGKERGGWRVPLQIVVLDD